MSIHRTKLPTPCSCGAEQERVSMKNPYIDDYADECLGDPETCWNARRALSLLNSWARSAARAEHAYDDAPDHEECES